MRRRTERGEAFTVNPRFAYLGPQGAKATEVIVDGLEAGYVWDERSIANSTLPNTRRPRKDGVYDHLQNCLDYLVLNFGTAQPTRREVERQAQLACRFAQRDTDIYDRQKVGAQSLSRGGY